MQVQKGQVRTTLEWKSSKLRWKLHEIDVRGELQNQYLCWRALQQDGKINWMEYMFLIVHIFLSIVSLYCFKKYLSDVKKVMQNFFFPVEMKSFWDF